MGQFRPPRVGTPSPKARYFLFSTSVLDRLLDPVGRCLSARAARALTGLRADVETQAPVCALAEKCNKGMLSPAERAEYEAARMAANMVAILPAKARAAAAASGVVPAVDSASPE